VKQYPLTDTDFSHFPSYPLPKIPYFPLSLSYSRGGYGPSKMLILLSAKSSREKVSACALPDTGLGSSAAALSSPQRPMGGEGTRYPHGVALLNVFLHVSAHLGAFLNGRRSGMFVAASPGFSGQTPAAASIWAHKGPVGRPGVTKLPINLVRSMVARRAPGCGRFMPQCPGCALTARSLRRQAFSLPIARTRR
jgi:hypothetical protein